MFLLTDYEDKFLEFGRSQAREAIRAALEVQKGNIRVEYSLSVRSLNDLSDKMKTFSSSTLKKDLEGGLSGKAADAAKTFLDAIAKPNLESPIKGV